LFRPLPADPSRTAVTSSPTTTARMLHSSTSETCSPRLGRRAGREVVQRGRGRVTSASSTPASRPAASAGSQRKTDASANSTTLATMPAAPNSQPS
jgi:hypothetical protein